MRHKKEKIVNKILTDLINDSFSIENQYLPKRLASSKNVKEETKILTLKNALMAWGKIIETLNKKRKSRKKLKRKKK